MKKILFAVGVIIGGVTLTINLFYKTYAPVGLRSETPVVEARVVKTPANKVKPELDIKISSEVLRVGEQLEIIWEVALPDARPFLFAGIRYGFESRAENLSLESYPNVIKPYQGTVPARFVDKLAIPDNGDVYVRGNILLDNVNYWSEEKKITVKR